ncbi:preprotein translocase subunit YajC [Tomitella biformata]|uniref:preprotein translocase subunit YajC n=1 Tax=Tomitella biformata TaxID=630403 RepID=UPI0004662623|nr:preprotein translocase subunit YajC [Tomitella biformata]
MELIFPLLILVLLVPLFLGSRRQKKALAAAKDLQQSLKIGDNVMTSAGLHAVVAGLQDTTVDLEIAEGVITRWERVVVREVVLDEVLEDEAPEIEAIDDQSVDGAFNDATSADIERFQK